MNNVNTTIIDKTISVMDKKEIKPNPIKNMNIHSVIIKSEMFL